MATTPSTEGKDAADDRRDRVQGIGRDIGVGLRAVRESQGMSLREMARRVGISASAISQIETGRSRPSVETLYGIVRELGISLDDLFPGNRAPAREGVAPGAPVVQRADSRQSIDLESGVRWERLTPTPDPEVDFLFVTYAADGSSSASGTLMRHAGREYGLVVDGTLEVAVGFDTYVLNSGDSIVFDSTTPHLLRATNNRPATAVWFVVGRRDSDSRKGSLDSPDPAAA